MTRKVVLTGIRPTGALHLGHYVGALQRWVEIQEAAQHECFFLVADVQALTTHLDQPELLKQSVRDVVLDWLSVGLNPLKPGVHFVLQSQVQERHELSMLLMMLAPYSEHMRNPTLKAELDNMTNATVGFMVYPVDQIADIHMVDPLLEDAELLVPVGADQVPHLEYSRSIARRFNTRYGNLLTPCSALVGHVGRLVGTDGQAKMSKSKGNTIMLSDNADEVHAKVMGMYTDPNHLRVQDPGDSSDDNPTFMYLRAFHPDQTAVEELAARYAAGGVGDVQVKKLLVEVLNAFLEPIRARRAALSDADVSPILRAGTEVAQEACAKVISQVRERMALTYP